MYSHTMVHFFFFVMDQRTTSSPTGRRDRFLLHVPRSVYQLLAVINRGIFLFNVVRDIRGPSFLYFVPKRMFCLIYGTIIDVNADKRRLWTLCVYRTKIKCASVESNRFSLGTHYANNTNVRVIQSLSLKSVNGTFRRAQSVQKMLSYE